MQETSGWKLILEASTLAYAGNPGFAFGVSQLHTGTSRKESRAKGLEGFLPHSEWETGKCPNAWIRTPGLLSPRMLEWAALALMLPAPDPPPQLWAFCSYPVLFPLTCSSSPHVPQVPCSLFSFIKTFSNTLCNPRALSPTWCCLRNLNLSPECQA